MTRAMPAPLPVDATPELPLDDQTCLDCRFFISYGTQLSGECHRHAPGIIRRPDSQQVKNQAVWPYVLTSDWCGEFVQHPERPEQ